MIKWRVEQTGLRQVYDALRETDRAATRVIEREITGAAKEAQAAAAAMVPGNPVSGWGPWNFSRNGSDLGFVPSEVASGFKVKKNNYRSRGTNRGISWSVQQMNRAGAIFEVMGSGSRVTDDPRYRNQALHLVRTVNNRFPMPSKGSRILTRAYYRAIPDASAFRERIADMIVDAARRAGLR